MQRNVIKISTSVFLLISEFSAIFAENMCDCIMRCKTRLLFISIAISLFIGCLSKTSLYPTEDIDKSIGTLTEALYFDYPIPNGEEFIISESSSETHVGDALRRFSQTKRINNSSSPRYGLTFAKKKQHLYPSTQHPTSFRQFPSGLMMPKRYLISLGRLII